MGLLDLLLSAGKAAADYAQKNPAETARVASKLFSGKTEVQHEGSNTYATNPVSKYDLRARARGSDLRRARYYKVIDAGANYVAVEFLDSTGTIVKRIDFKRKAHSALQIGVKCELW